MTIATPYAPTRRAARTPRRVAVMPAYNEEKTIISVLERLEPLADELIIVDDGSVDNTRELVLEWAADRPHVKLICFNQNRGMSAAYYRAFQELAKREVAGEVSSDDIVLTVDADGQHDPADVDRLVDHLVKNKLDAVIARRDLSIYTLYKRIGNFLISLWASIWAAQRLYDVESGYRAFRVGALLAALRYYKGYRYSETVEVAVILARMGYRVDNNYLVPVPIFRSNTRLKDLAIDIAAMPAAAWRYEARRAAPAGVPRSLVYYLALIAPLALGLMTLNVLTHRLFLADDSMQHYSHVWYLSTQLFEHGRLPLHIASLDNGQAMMFPYGFVPYLLGAVLYQPLGDWGTTLLMVAGVLGLAYTASLARPVLHDPWLLLIFIANPFFIDSLYSFQLASVWSGLFFFLFVWAFERDRRLSSAVLFWLAVSSHPIVGGFAMVGYGVYVALANRERLRPFLITAACVGVALIPIFWMTLQTPSIGERSPAFVVLSVLDALTRRGTVLFLPLILGMPAVTAYVRRAYWRVLPVVLCITALGLSFSLGLVHVGDLNRGGYPGAVHASSDIYGAFFASTAFQPDAVYRVMEPTDREDGMYRFLRHGAIIGNEFFSESFQRRDWTESQFACYARFKSLDYDVIESAYDRVYEKNENALLAGIVRRGEAGMVYSDPHGRFTVYDLHALVAGGPKPASLKECGL